MNHITELFNINIYISDSISSSISYIMAKNYSFTYNILWLITFIWFDVDKRKFIEIGFKRFNKLNKLQF